MMPGLFNRISGTSAATLFEIRLDNDIILLRGGENEASSQLLKGVVVLCLPSSLKVEDVHLRMTGQLKVAWNETPSVPSSGNRASRITSILDHKWPAFVGGAGPGSSSKGTTLVAGNYEWPFEFVIPGSTAESIEGLPESHIIYKLKATVARGKFAHDLHAYKPVRVVRTLDPSALELSHAMTVENVWPNKIEYQLIIPQKAIIFGTSIEVQMRFTSLLKGLRIGVIKCQLVESQEFSTPAQYGHTEKTFKHTRDIDSWFLELNDEEHYHDVLHETGQDGYSLDASLPLPKTLQKCLQDVDVHGIKVRHKVKFNIALHNPDGHVSELRATLPVTIFISPNMPLDAAGCLVDQTPMSTQSVDIEAHAPPLYGQHILDQLYADMDQTGFMTPAVNSGMNTPFHALSRSGSQENLALSGADLHANGAVTPAALSSRLQNLNASSRNSSSRRLNGDSGMNTPHLAPHAETDSESYFNANDHSGQNSNPLSRRVSEEENHESSNVTSGLHTPEHVDFNELGDLSKVPSYSTAIRTPARGLSYNDAVPNYNTATSTPPSPVRAHSALNTTSAGITNPNGVTPRSDPRSTLGFTPIEAPAPVLSGDLDERRRLHILRHRERSF